MNAQHAPLTSERLRVDGRHPGWLLKAEKEAQALLCGSGREAMAASLRGQGEAAERLAALRRLLHLEVEGAANPLPPQLFSSATAVRSGALPQNPRTRWATEDFGPTPQRRIRAAALWLDAALLLDDTNLVCLDRQTGQWRWSYLLREGHGVTSLAAADERLFLAQPSADRQSLILSLASGTPLGGAPGGLREFHVCGETLVASDNLGTLSAFDSYGRELWRDPDAGLGGRRQMAALPGGGVVALQAAGTPVAYGPDGTRLWQCRQPGQRWDFGPFVLGGEVWLGSSAEAALRHARYERLDARTGDPSGLPLEVPCWGAPQPNGANSLVWTNELGHLVHLETDGRLWRSPHVVSFSRTLRWPLSLPETGETLLAHDAQLCALTAEGELLWHRRLTHFDGSVHAFEADHGEVLVVCNGTAILLADD